MTTTGTTTSNSLRFAGLIAVILLCSGSHLAAAPQFEFRATEAVRATNPPLPNYPLQLILDDDTPDGTVGISSGGQGAQFLWFNQFTVSAAPVELAEVWVLFPSGPDMAPGNAVQIVVYHDPDQDPTNGADLLAAWDETIQITDDFTFSVYTLPSPIEISQPGDLLVGVVNRWVTTGASPASQPASIDTTASLGRSWIAAWTGDPADPPVLPADSLYGLVDGFEPGNWMIRAFGNQAQQPAIPTTGLIGRAALVTLLAGAGLWLLWRRD